MSAAAEVRRLAAQALAPLTSHGFAVKQGVAVRTDALVRVVAMTPAPPYGGDQATVDVSFALGLPGLSAPDRHGSSFAFENSPSGLGVQDAWRLYKGPDTAEALARRLAEDALVGLRWLEGFEEPSGVIGLAVAGTDVGGRSPRLDLYVAATWAAFLHDERVDDLLARLRAIDPTSDVVAEQVEVVQELRRAAGTR